MGVLDQVQEGISNLMGDVTNVTANNKEAILGAVVGAAAVGTTIAATKIIKKRKKKKSKKSRSKNKYKRRSKYRKHRRNRGRGRRTPRTAGKGRDRSTKRIRYTKKGQPYVITPSGKAKFIKKSSAKRSYKQKGGRY